MPPKRLAITNGTLTPSLSAPCSRGFVDGFQLPRGHIDHTNSAIAAGTGFAEAAHFFPDQLISRNVFFVQRLTGI